MSKRSTNLSLVEITRPARLGEFIHGAVRAAIEQAVHEEREAALGAGLYQRSQERNGYRNGSRERTLSGPTGPLPLPLPRARIAEEGALREWQSKLVPATSAACPS